MAEATSEQVSLLADLITTAQQRRDEQIMAPVLADFARDEALARNADWPTLIGQACIDLHGRMEFLARHPYLPSWLGGSAIHINRQHDRYTTPPMFATTEPEEPDGLSFESELLITTGGPAYSGSTHNKWMDIIDRYTETTTGTLKDMVAYRLNYRLGSPQYTSVAKDESSLAIFRQPSEDTYKDVLGKLMAVHAALRPHRWLRRFPELTSDSSGG